jgi:hypothetical protein
VMPDKCVHIAVAGISITACEKASVTRWR